MDAAAKLQEGLRVFDIEIKALQTVRDCLDETFISILDEIIACKGKLVLIGMGKPGHVARKLAATFSSLGTPSFFLHPGEAMHGDLGMLDSNDVVIAISYSGESDEIISIISNIRLIGAKLIAITGNRDSTLAKAAEIVQVLPHFDEACHMGLAPTSSTTVAMVYGDALAVAASEVYGFREIDFGKRHPAGSLGKKLILRVSDLMASGDRVPQVLLGSKVMDAIKEITNKQLGVVSIVDNNGVLCGILTDGDVRRIITAKKDIYTISVDEVMTETPKFTSQDTLAYAALQQIRENNINCLPVVEERRLVGTITWQQIVSSGIVL